MSSLVDSRLTPADRCSASQTLTAAPLSPETPRFGAVPQLAAEVPAAPGPYRVPAAFPRRSPGAARPLPQRLPAAGAARRRGWAWAWCCQGREGGAGVVKGALRWKKGLQGGKRGAEVVKGAPEPFPLPRRPPPLTGPPLD